MIDKALLLSRISSELDLLKQDFQDIEVVISRDLESAVRAAPHTRQSLQQMDRMIQTLSCLSDCIGELATSDPGDTEISRERALKSIALDSVAERLVYGVEANAQATLGETELW